jgi:hypothetical protein
MTVFFLCSYPLAARSIVDPGNWGRILRSYNLSQQNNWWLPLREFAFENVRLRYFPSKPSRLSSVFVCESQSDAEMFRQINKRAFDIVYEAEFVDPALPQHRGCLSHFDNAAQGDLSGLEKRGNDYWSASVVHRPEIVSESAIRIVRRV